MRNHKQLGWVKWFCLGTLAGALIAIPLVTLAKTRAIRNNPTSFQVKATVYEVESAQLTASPEAETKPPVVPVAKDSIKAKNTISEEALTDFLQKKNSPLAPYSKQILQSDYWSTIIGICSIEQYGCSRAPGYNYWGLMKSGGGLQRFGSQEEGIEAISKYLDKQYSKGRTTLTSFRGFYCVNHNYPGNVCPGWETTVSSVKAQVENYGPQN